MFTEGTVANEFEQEIEQEIEEIKLNTDWNTEYYEIETETGEEYIVLENYEKAEALAKERVLQDLETEPELFNQEWLENLRTHRLQDQSFNDYAAERAVEEDGFAHFLAHYDGDSIETTSEFVIMRVN